MPLTKTEVFEKLEAARLDGTTPGAVATRIAAIQGSPVESLVNDLRGPALDAVETFLNQANKSGWTVDTLNSNLLLVFVSWDYLFGDEES